MLGCATSEVESAEAKYYQKSKTQHSFSYQEVVEYAYRHEIQLKETGTFTAPKCEYNPETSQGTTYLQYTYGAVTAEVEVDTETGKVQVKKMVAAYDVGKAINPLSVEGQIEGGTVQGLGYAIMEEMIHKDGIVQNPNLADYYIPTSLDIPEIKTIIVEYPGHLGPYGAKAIGEPPIVLPAPAIVNSIDNALGIRLYEIPTTPDKVLIALKRAREAKK
jgi:CO/xanthine dehydrogenase Mo-binding subunit